MNRQQGMTLVELVISIVIIGIAAAALYSAMAAITGRSADPLLRQQSLSIAEGYLEEILLQPFLDSSNAVCPAPPASRASFDNVCDYNGLNDNGVRDARGQAIAALVDEAQARHVTLVATLHQVDVALSHFPRVVGMRDGQVAFDLPAALVSRDKLAALYDQYEHELRGDVPMLPDAPPTAPQPVVMHCR